MPVPWVPRRFEPKATGSDFLESLPQMVPDGCNLSASTVSTYATTERLSSSFLEGDVSLVPEERPKTRAAMTLQFLGQVPAISLICLFHLMVGIPFGVSYFPMNWGASDGASEADEGPFPLPGKESLGIRMFLFSTLVGQLVLTMMSKFANPIGLQMVENVPFCHELARIVIAHQGYGLEALSTLFIMFGLASAAVGIAFLTLGKLSLGRVMHFLPSHVLVGCIGGIGLYCAKIGIEVSMAETFSIPHIVEHWNQIWVVLLLEFVLRGLVLLTKDSNGKPRFALMPPIYFCMITPIFYLALKVIGVSVEEATEMGFFFPPLTDDTSPNGFMSVLHDPHLWDIWRVINLSTVSWRAVWDSVPTLVALTLFSLIHVPINIPAFALSTGTQGDMDNELVAHGCSNLLVGAFGGLQNYMAYTQSFLYHKSGGTGKASGFAVALVTGILFVVGPTIATYIPRCMAGTLLMHVGLDLFLEGVWDSFRKSDPLEYCSIWLLVISMTLYGMEAAMQVGAMSAVFTYAVQSATYLTPIRGSMPATTLRSSVANRSCQAQAVLNSPNEGRGRILAVQLQGHLFFGNTANFTKQLSHLLAMGREGDAQPPLVVIVDCSLVLWIDSSAAQAISTLMDSLLKTQQAELFVFVSGSDHGFPTAFPLEEKLLEKGTPCARKENNDLEGGHADEATHLLMSERSLQSERHNPRPNGCFVCPSLDEALAYAEDALLARSHPFLLLSCPEDSFCDDSDEFESPSQGFVEYEREHAIVSLRKACPMTMPTKDAEVLLSCFDREVFKSGEYLWHQGSQSDSAKLLVSGTLLAELENEAGTTETIEPGHFLGEFGLVNHEERISSVHCLSQEAILYSLSSKSFDNLVEQNPHIARYVDMICIKDLSVRLQHVSNRVFETKCLPV